MEERCEGKKKEGRKLTSGIRSRGRGRNRSREEFEKGRDASTVEGHLRRSEAAIFVHLVDSDGDMVIEGQDAAAGRDLQIHRRSVPLLQEGHSKMAELVEAQSVLQRLLHQGRRNTNTLYRLNFLPSKKTKLV